MIYPGVTNIKHKNFIRIAATCFLVLTIGFVSFAQQYKGAPVKKDRLIEAIRSRQLQTRDIVTIIKSNGVNFALTPKIKESLIDAGARPEVIKAIDENLRLPSNNDQLVSKNGKLTSADYDDLLDQAIYIYKKKNNPQGAMQFLKTAIKLNPKDPAAYQSMTARMCAMSRKTKGILKTLTSGTTGPTTPRGKCEQSGAHQSAPVQRFLFLGPAQRLGTFAF